MIQERVNQAAATNVWLDADTTHKLVTLNRQRTQLMNEIDARDGGEERIKL